MTELSSDFIMESAGQPDPESPIVDAEGGQAKEPIFSTPPESDLNQLEEDIGNKQDGRNAVVAGAVVESDKRRQARNRRITWLIAVGVISGCVLGTLSVSAYKRNRQMKGEEVNFLSDLKPLVWMGNQLRALREQQEKKAIVAGYTEMYMRETKTKMTKRSPDWMIERLTLNDEDNERKKILRHNTMVSLAELYGYQDDNKDYQLDWDKIKADLGEKPDAKDQELYGLLESLESEIFAAFEEDYIFVERLEPGEVIMSKDNASSRVVKEQPQNKKNSGFWDQPGRKKWGNSRGYF